MFAFKKWNIISDHVIDATFTVVSDIALLNLFLLLDAVGRFSKKTAIQ